MKKIIFFTFTIGFLLFGISHAQWQQDVRLTNDPQTSNTSHNSVWCIAALVNNVHVVWWDTRDGNWEIYYKRSTDGGINWGGDIRLTNDTAGSVSPSLSVNGSSVHVVWDDGRDGYYEVYYKRSIDEGISWSTDIRLTNTNNSISPHYPSISVSGSVVHVVWQDYRDGNFEIYYKHSTDGGVSWGTDTRLTNFSGSSYNPSISLSGSVVHVVWSDNRDGNWEIYYKHSTDGGVSWGADTRLTNYPANSWHPSLSLSGSVIHVVWDDNRDGSTEIYYKRSTDGGVNWGTDTRLTNDPTSSDNPSVSVSGLVVYTVWDDNRDGTFNEIYYKRSTDGGISWGADTRLTNNPFRSAFPSVSISGLIVHVVWTDERDGNMEIYYKRDPTGNPIGIKNISSQIPKDFSLSQNYPNPFNPKTTIEFGNPKSGLVELKLYDILGKEVQTLLSDYFTPGTYSVELDCTNLASGSYFYKLISGYFVETRKMILAK